jgi:hypothetical protein
MKSTLKYCLAIICLIQLNSCYHKQILYSFTPSNGGVRVDSSIIYLAEAKQYQMPKGISRFPDGGQIKVRNQIFGLFQTDTLKKNTVLIAILGEVKGWPSRFATRIEKSQNYIIMRIKG